MTCARPLCRHPKEQHFATNYGMTSKPGPCKLKDCACSGFLAHLLPPLPSKESKKP